MDYRDVDVGEGLGRLSRQHSISVLGSKGPVTYYCSVQKLMNNHSHGAVTTASSEPQTPALILMQHFHRATESRAMI
jgi:hypothetical protein